MPTLPDYSEPYQSLKVQVKEFNELMEEKNYPAATRLAVTMHEMTGLILSILNNIYLKELCHADEENRKSITQAKLETIAGTSTTTGDGTISN